MSISPHHTGFRNISSLLAESKLKITRDVSLAIEETNNFQSLGPGDPNSIFRSPLIATSKTVTPEAIVICVSWKFVHSAAREDVKSAQRYHKRMEEMWLRVRDLLTASLFACSTVVGVKQGEMMNCREARRC